MSMTQNGQNDRALLPGFIDTYCRYAHRISPMTPQLFNMQYPQPLDPMEVIALCEEVSAVRNIPVVEIGTKDDFWLEETNLYMDAGQYMFFPDGDCPEEYTSTGTYHVTRLKNMGVKKSLTLMDIKHSLTVSGMGAGIGNLLSGFPSGEGEPGGYGATGFVHEAVADVKEKEIRKGMSLVPDGEDWTLIVGNSSTDALEYDGIETLVTSAAGAHANISCPTGTFSADDFHRFISESCAKPTHIWGHPLALSMVARSYFSLGFQGSQYVQNPSGANIIPGLSWGDSVHTQIGTLGLIGDVNFTRTALAGECGGLFRSNLYPLRMVHNREPLVYRPTQFPLDYQDLAPGCTAISMEIWLREALTIKAICAQSLYTANLQGNIATTCTRMGSLGPGRSGGAPSLT